MSTYQPDTIIGIAPKICTSAIAWNHTRFLKSNELFLDEPDEIKKVT